MVPSALRIRTSRNIPRERRFFRTAMRFSDRDFQKRFRMSRRGYELLCASVTPFIPAPRLFDPKRPPLSRAEKVLMCVYRLATGMSYLQLGDQFGVGKSTAQAAVKQVVDAIAKPAVWKSYIKYPSGARIQSVRPLAPPPLLPYI